MQLSLSEFFLETQRFRKKNFKMFVFIPACLSSPGSLKILATAGAIVWWPGHNDILAHQNLTLFSHICYGFSSPNAFIKGTSSWTSTTWRKQGLANYLCWGMTSASYRQTLVLIWGKGCIFGAKAGFCSSNKSSGVPLHFKVDTTRHMSSSNVWIFNLFRLEVPNWHQ